MKADTTYIPIEEMLKIARDAGCEILEQKSFWKISRPGVDDQLLYVSNGVLVGRCDLSGFELKEPEVARYLGGEKNGRVLYQLRFDKPASHIKEHFRQLCLGLGKFTSLPKSKRGRPVGLKGSQKQAVSVVVVQAELSPQQMIDKLVADLEKKRSLAKQMGSPLSKKTEKEFADKIAELRSKLQANP